MKSGLKDINGVEFKLGDEIRFYLYGTSPVPYEVISQVGFSQGMFSAMEMNGEPIALRDIVRVSNVEIIKP